MIFNETLADTTLFGMDAIGESVSLIVIALPTVPGWLLIVQAKLMEIELNVVILRLNLGQMEIELNDVILRLNLLQMEIELNVVILRLN
ncbi:hypothetical protein CHS0354_001399 [Potamilus streckersoni]|uniref:Uncharacterized protein n=1 Tax=Potamilus streckersoni TaxID=2493646 RepID=A0AAE0W8D8_9BIVA|nr:hypothetical protein CHS0354_001399 [Potamilus streckersoni]